MRKVKAGASIVFGIIAAILVFTPFFKTPPALITLFGILGIIAGIAGRKESGALAAAGIVISAVSLLYLVLLFIQLGG